MRRGIFEAALNHNVVVEETASYLQKVVAWRFDQLLQGLLVVVFARRGLFLLECHDLIGEGRARTAEELPSAALDVVAPIRVLHVLGARDVIDQLGLQVCEVLALLLVQWVAYLGARLRVEHRRMVERVAEWLVALRAGCQTH